jgi:protein SCO1
MSFQKTILFLSLICTINIYSAEMSKKEYEKKIGVYENLNSIIPLDTIFTDEYGKTKTLKEFINKKPTILALNYYSCTSLCSPLLAGVTDVLNRMKLKPYVDYNVLTISIEPLDTPQIALDKKKGQFNNITIPFPPQAWSFLTGDQKNIDIITNAVGFEYQKREKDGVVDYLHPGLIIVLSPNGKIARYLNGVQFLSFDLKLAVLEASQERSGPTIANTLLFCFAYDPKSKTYIFQAEKIIGIFILLVIAIFFIYLLKTGRKEKTKEDE